MIKLVELTVWRGVENNVQGLSYSPARCPMDPGDDTPDCWEIGIDGTRLERCEYCKSLSAVNEVSGPDVVVVECSYEVL